MDLIGIDPHLDPESHPVEADLTAVDRPPHLKVYPIVKTIFE